MIYRLHKKITGSLLRSRAAQPQCHFRFIEFFIPALLFIIGLIAATQTYAWLVGYNPIYTGEPFFVFREKFLFFPRGIGSIILA
jgi:hypothetical protein